MILFDSICFKDASGTSTPKVVYETIKRARKLVGDKITIVMHSHDTAGCCVQQYVSALDAGANQLDLSMQPVSGGTCQPDIITMWHARRGTEYDLGIDIHAIQKAEDVFQAQFGDDRILRQAEASLAKGKAQPAEIVNQMLEAVHAFVGEAEQSDDITMLVVKRK